MEIIGLCGRAGAGKDTVANLLCRYHRFNPYSFADPIRVMLDALMEFVGVEEPREWMTDRKKKEAVIPELGVSYRVLAQKLGTEWGRQQIRDTLWLDIAARYMHSWPSHARFVIADVRFPNEADWIRKHGGRLIRVQRGVAPVAEHESERFADELVVDDTIDNTRSISHLGDEVRRILRTGLARPLIG